VKALGAVSLLRQELYVQFLQAMRSFYKFKLESGKVVRYTGLDAPVTVDPKKPAHCFGKEDSAEKTGTLWIAKL
jgi:hypothetical protein